MIYELTTKEGLLKPKAVLALENLGEIQLFNKEQGLRPPLGIYNVTFSEIVGKMLTLVRLLETAREDLPHINEDNSKWKEKILDATDHVLDAIMQHLDAYKSIICCFYSDCGSKQAQKSNRSLQCEIRIYRDHVAKIVNLIKHKQRKLSAILFHAPGVYGLGYYVEGVTPDGTIAPDPKVHENSNVAISFNRDLPFHICNLYYCSAVLATHLHRICGVTPAKSSGEHKAGDQLSELLQRVAAMPMEFFSDEVAKPVPLVRLIPLRNTEHFNVTLELPSKRGKARSIPSGCQAQVSFKGDGVSRSFKFPYFEGEKPNKKLQSPLGLGPRLHRGGS